MLFHLYKNRIKILCKDYNAMITVFILPILLSVLAYLIFGISNQSINTKQVSVGLVETSHSDELYEYLVNVSDDRGVEIFRVTKLKKDDGLQLLNENAIQAYIDYDNGFIIYANQWEEHQLITKSYIDLFNLNKDKGASNNYIKVNKDMYDTIHHTYLIFVTIVAFTCIMSSHWGFREISDYYDRNTAISIRIRMSSSNKLKIFVANYCAILTLHLFSICLLLLFLTGVLKVFQYPQMIFMLIISFVSTILGINLGILLYGLIPLNKRMKKAILNCYIIVGSFLPTYLIIKSNYYFFDNLLWIKYINPASLIMDTFYNFTYYHNILYISRNVLLMFIISQILLLCNIPLRRRYNASI